MSKKLTAVTATSTAPASADLIYTVDVSDTSGGVSGTSKKLTVETLASQMVAVNGAATAKVAPWATAALLQTDLASLPVGFVAWTSDRPFPWRVVAVGSYVADGGITLVAGSRAAVLDFTGPIDVRWYGAAVGASAATQTTAINAGITAGVLTGLEVTVPIPVSITSIRIKNGLKKLTFAPGATVTATATAGQATIEWDGVFFTTTPVTDCTVRGLRLNMNGLDEHPCLMSTAIDCEMSDFKIWGVHATRPGVQLHYDSTGTTIKDFEITLDAAGVMSGVYVTGDVAADGGWSTGAIATPATPPHHNTIQDGVVIGGGYAVGLHGTNDNTVTNVRGRDQVYRGLIGICASRNTIRNFRADGFASSGVHFAYGCDDNTVYDPVLYSPTATGEAAIQAYVACARNKIFNPKIDASTRFGIYFAVDAIGNEAHGGTINGGLVQLAALALESDWADTPPGDAIYARPNWAATTAPRTEWANGDSVGNVFANITVTDMDSSKALIALTQLGANAGLKRNVFREITSVSTDGTTLPSYEVYAYEETSGKLEKNKLLNCDFANISPAAIWQSRGRAHFDEVTNCSLYNRNYYFFDAPAGSTTLDVSACDEISTSLNVSPTSVTALTGGIDGQRVIVRMSANTTLVHSSSLVLRGLVNIVGTSSSEFVAFRRMSGVWIEQSRTAA